MEPAVARKPNGSTSSRSRKSQARKKKKENVVADMDAVRRHSVAGPGGYRSHEGRPRAAPLFHDDPSIALGIPVSRYLFKDPLLIGNTRRYFSRHSRRDSLDSVGSGPLGNPRYEPTVTRAPEPVQLSAVADVQLIRGLKLQRLFDEKPDVDNMASALMQLYDRLEYRGNSVKIKPELIDRIVLSALRIRSKTEAHINRASWRMRAVLRQGRRLFTKRRTLRYNAPRIDRNFIGICRLGHRDRNFNDVYENLYKILNKIPGLAQLELMERQLRVKQAAIIRGIEDMKNQISAQKAQLENICELMAKAAETAAAGQLLDMEDDGSV
ncbi:flagellar hook-associated protein FlgK [Babesia caballi]|uniref:Flagellar hook-associated protein FlgK n=1 Tax=Babesia caballi TaxID=5871 RepID=A0AAV4LM02_BABCB|nr:flagellar hook-associated protein FlgK [Babesia caballi]